MRKCFLFTTSIPYNWNWYFPLLWCNDKNFFHSLYLVSQKQGLPHLIQFCSCLEKQRLFFTFILLLASFIFSFSPKINFSITLNNIFSLNFDNIKKPEHVFAWETLCNRNIFIEFIIWYQTSSWYIKCGKTD